MRPVGAELEFHRNAGHDAEHEVNAEDSSPEAGALVIHRVVTSQCNRLEHHDEQGQAHGQLWKQVVEGGCKREAEAVYNKCAIHMPLVGNSCNYPVPTYNPM